MKAKRKYEIQWLNNAPGATGFTGWTSDGIGDANEFTNRREAERVRAAIRREARMTEGRIYKMRVWEVTAA